MKRNSLTVINAVILCTLITGIAYAATIQLPRTGQSACYDAAGAVIACTGTGQDADKLKGFTWPSPRFTDNGNGTVTDNLTGLIWLKNANCFNSQLWTDAVASANTLTSGACGLSDGSIAGQWRLPNRKELMSLVDRSKYNPALPSGHPFTLVQSDKYWSSSNPSSGEVWYIDFGYGYVYPIDWSSQLQHFAWPVRGGQ